MSWVVILFLIIKKAGHARKTKHLIKWLALSAPSLKLRRVVRLKIKFNHVVNDFINHSYLMKPK